MTLSTRVSKWVFFLLIIVLFLTLPNYGYAQQEASTIQTITTKISEVTSGWHDALRPYMLSLFWTLVFISFSYSASKMAIMGADVTEIFSELIKTVIVTGFWLYIINNSYEFASAIVNSLSKAASISSGVDADIQPGDIIKSGLELSAQMIEAASGIGEKVVFGMCCIIVVILYFFIAAIVFVMLIEVYIVTGMSIILLGFAGSPWTSDVSKKYFLFTFGVGIKLFSAIIVVRFGERLVHDAIVVTGSYERIFAIVGIIFLITYLTKRIPDLAQSLIGGISSSGWGDVKDIKGMAAATAGAVAGAAFSAMQALAAGKSTNNEKSSSSEGGSTGNPTLDAASAGGGATGSGGAENNDSNPAALPNEGSGASPENPKTSASNDSKKTDSATSTKNSGLSRVGAVAAYAARAAKAYGQARLQTTVGRMIDPTTKNNATPFNVGLKIRENMMSKKISGSGTSQDGNKK
ncbi:P-type conjugative transfer protein TrbL [Cardiobacterium hominis]|uniref:P-type conjugative transfer protein TrbL n=1 Tax=Cardiobacterium hominis TaxID=2718 RepID=UPI0028E3106C|nr:P-type conjugative transfer protein TrbL [Cardiobacterium hominis]